MKLPFDFGVKLFFRLLLPGFFLLLGFIPILFAFLDALSLASYKEIASVLATIIFGWLILSADMPIYMLLEGRRYWPKFLWFLFLKREKNRLDKLNHNIEDFYKKKEVNCLDDIARQRYVEASVGKRFFPLDENGERVVKYPTRLGNTLTSFETYADSRYGLDDVFYWPRIWINLSKDLREELDNQQAMADSSIYSTIAFATSGLIWFFYGLLNKLNELFIGYINNGYISLKPLGQGIFAYILILPSAFLLL